MMRVKIPFMIVVHGPSIDTSVDAARRSACATELSQ